MDRKVKRDDETRWRREKIEEAWSFSQILKIRTMLRNFDESECEATFKIVYSLQSKMKN
jgi:hypothetical protein